MGTPTVYSWYIQGRRQMNNWEGRHVPIFVFTDCKNIRFRNKLKEIDVKHEYINMSLSPMIDLPPALYISRHTTHS